MKRVLLAALLCLALVACRGFKSGGPTPPPEPTQGTAAVEATVSGPAR